MPSFIKEVKAKFKAAKESGSLFSFESTEFEKESNGIDFQITLVPALGKKDTEKKKDTDEPKEKVNPFLNPDPALVIKEVDEHVILLNKFAVIPNHVLVITKEFKKQTEPPFPEDVYEAFKVMKDFGNSNPTLSFYNCGEKSGASQGHKHLQIIPLDSDSDVQPPIKKLYDDIQDRHAGQIYAINKLPYIHVIIPLDNNIIRSAGNDKEALTDYLAQMFFGLLDAMFQQMRENSVERSTSYNFLMTQDFMMLIPRSKEHASIEHNGKTFEFSINSLGFAGFLLAKTEEEFEALKAQENLIDILTQVAVPWSSEGEKIEAEREVASQAELA